MTIADVHGDDLYRPVLIPFNWIGLLQLFAIAATGGIVLSSIRFPNAWMMGPLIAMIVTTASGLAFSSMSGALTNAGQVLLGCALGARFSRQFLSDALRVGGPDLYRIDDGAVGGDGMGPGECGGHLPAEHDIGGCAGRHCRNVDHRARCNSVSPS